MISVLDWANMMAIKFGGEVKAIQKKIKRH